MSRVRLLPHRVAGDESVQWGSWWFKLNEQSVEPLQDHIPGWDYASKLRIGTSISVDSERLASSTGISDVERINLACQVDCIVSGYRLVTSCGLESTGSNVAASSVEADLPSSEIAGSIRISACLVLSESRTRRADRSAFLSGSRLLSSPSRLVTLEGHSGRFPTEGVDFTSIGYPDAPWHILTTFDNLSENFLATVRLLVNTGHPVGRRLLSNDREVFSGVLRFEIVRSLIVKISSGHLDSLRDDLEDESVGSVVDQMCQSLVGDDLHALTQCYLEDPLRLDLILQGRLNQFAPIDKALK